MRTTSLKTISPPRIPRPPPDEYTPVALLFFIIRLDALKISEPNVDIPPQLYAVLLEIVMLYSIVFGDINNDNPPPNDAVLSLIVTS